MKVKATFAVVLACVGCWALGAVSSASAARIDKSFGIRGVVDPEPTVPEARSSSFLDEVVTGPKGGIYLVYRVVPQGCSPNCELSAYLTRLRPDGSRDPEYGIDGRFFIKTEGDSALAVDAGERQTVASVRDTEINVVRILPEGQTDKSFGTEGHISIPCSCKKYQVQVAVLDGGEVAILAYGRNAPDDDSSPFEAVQARLTPEGQLDSRFANNGTKVVEFPVLDDARSVSISPSGAAVFVGPEKSGTLSFPTFVARLDPHGNLDRRFGERVKRALASIKGPDPESIVQAAGSFYILGRAGSYSFVLRVKANGALDRRFGRRGVRFFRDYSISADADRAGHLLVVGERSTSRAFWLGVRGRVKPPILVLRGAGSEGGIVVQMQGNRPLIFVPNPDFRGGGPGFPQLIRLLPWKR